MDMRFCAPSEPWPNTAVNAALKITTRGIGMLIVYDLKRNHVFLIKLENYRINRFTTRADNYCPLGQQIPGNPNGANIAPGRTGTLLPSRINIKRAKNPFAQLIAKIEIGQ